MPKGKLSRKKSPFLAVPHTRISVSTVASARARVVVSELSARHKYAVVSLCKDIKGSAFPKAYDG